MAIRVGKEARWKVYLASGLGVLVLLLAIRVLGPLFFGSSPSPVSAPVSQAPATTAPEATGSAGHEAVKLPTGAALDPTLHPEVMAQAEETVYAGNGRNIFSANSVAPTPVHIEKPQPFRPVEPSGPPPPPPPPPINIKFYGYSAANGGPRQVFLLHGDDIFLAHEGDIVDRRYRVAAIHPFSVDVEDIPFHNTQSIPLTQN